MDAFEDGLSLDVP